MRRKIFIPQLATAALLVWCLSGGPSTAEVRLSGTPDRIVLRTIDATMPEILAALHSTFDLDVEFNGTTARRFTGTYFGSVRQVLSRLLAGEDYVLRSAADGIVVRLIGKSALDGAAVSSSLPAAAQGSRLVALRQGRIKRTSD
jgi:hypothetical protein